MFVRNAWYVVALARNVDRKPVRVRLLDDALVLYRKQNGELVALRDRCPHRHAPLSMGTLAGDELQCRYHGFKFDCSGACTAIPGEKAIPAAVSVRSFPVAERYGLVWCWAGDAARADLAKIPAWQWHGAPGYESYFAEFEIDAPVELIVDNLMDLTHVHFVHRILGADLMVHNSEPMRTWEDAAGVHFRRDLKKPGVDLYIEIAGDYLAPSAVITSAVPKKAGSDDVQPGPVSQVIHCLTPQGPGSTHYIALKCWNLKLQPHEIAAVHEQVDVTAAEDKAIIEAQFANQQLLAPAPEALIRADKAAVMSRRLYEKLLDADRSQDAATAA
jgi:phenylpropionate dioxygenase-like ring-hydroxylating dioxygenase large terminal subunit